MKIVKNTVKIFLPYFQVVKLPRYHLDTAIKKIAIANYDLKLKMIIVVFNQFAFDLKH